MCCCWKQAREYERAPEWKTIVQYQYGEMWWSGTVGESNGTYYDYDCTVKWWTGTVGVTVRYGT
jgi:hypothetical protein